MKQYQVEYLDTKDNTYANEVLLCQSFNHAFELAKTQAYKWINDNKIVIRYVSVKDNYEHYVYNMLTKTTQKYY